MELVLSEIEEQPTICLNMIVKNESHIIQDTLEMLCNKINFSYWVICDTGSTDSTQDIIIQFFKERNIPGELYNDEWKNFAHNRNLALNYAVNKSDLLFIFDADDEIHGDILMPDKVDFDGYYLNFGSKNGISYQRILLINNKLRWDYKSIVHEYICCLEPNSKFTSLEGNYYIVSGRTGSRSQDPKKYLNDAKLLEEGYVIAKNNNDAIYLRYGFYTAQSYHDYGDYKKAIEWYKVTLSNPNWQQEKYIACLKLFELYSLLNEKEAGFYYLVESFKYDKDRCECLLHLIRYYCNNDQNDMAYLYYSNFSKFYETDYLNEKNISNNRLFIECDKFDFYLPYYMILVADKVKETYPQAKKTIYKMYEIIFIKKTKIFEDFFIGNLLYNLQYFIDLCISFNPNFIDLFQEYITHLESNNYNLLKHDIMKIYSKYNVNIKCFDISLPEQNFSQEDCLKSNKILFFTGFSDLPWNYTYSMTNALGGSESAVIYLSKNFPNDYEIYVAGQVAEEKIENVTYLNLDSLKKIINTTAFHTVIVSRYIGFYEMFPTTSFYQSFIWGHDVHLHWYGTNLSVDNILTKWSKKITGCVCQTEWHKSFFLSIYPELKDKINIINNGIDTKMFKSVVNSDNKKITNRFIYTSCSERGLSRLLELWQQITDNLPDAELYISSYNKFPGNNEEIKLQNIINGFSNIKHVGKLNKTELYNLMSTAEYWLYPTNFNETSCITSMEMLMSEVICIYYPVAGLVNTLGDYGLQVSRGNELDSILNLSLKQKIEIRKRGKEYALSCSWENRAKQWISMININNSSENKNLTDTEKRMFYLYESLRMNLVHTKLLKTISESFTPNIIYDIGANALHWTREARKVWNNSSIYAFDVINEAEELYKSQNINYHIGVLSDEDNKIVKFYENKEHPAGNSYYKEIGHPNSNNIYPDNSFTEKNSMTLSSIVKTKQFPNPELIKIDVQGAELDIIRGSLDVINKAKYLIVELQHTQYNRGAPLCDETISFLNKNGWDLYAEKFCDNGPDADYCFINRNYCFNKKKKLAIFNGFPFHYELFGYIIEYSLYNNYDLTIYTNFDIALGYIDFLKEHFKNYFEFKHFTKFENERDNYDFVFLTTDDDFEFKNEWITSNTICIDHHSTIRRPQINHRIATRPFEPNFRKWGLPCFSLIKYNEKLQENADEINIVIIGRNFTKENITIMKRLKSNNINNKNIIFHIISKIYAINKEYFDEFDNSDKNIKVKLYTNLDTISLQKILIQCKYILNITFSDPDYYTKACSGSIMLAFSNLIPLIISKQNNTLYNFKNIIEFDEDSTEPIFLKDIDLLSLEKERDELISMFHKNVNEIINPIEKNTDIQKLKHIETYSQNFQDLFAISMLKEKNNGTFLEIGSNHPINFNNTYLLYKNYGWKGVMIEYDSSFEKSYIELRPNNKYIINDARKINYREFLDNNNFPKNIDYLQIDLEVDNRSTLDVLELFNNTVFDKYKFATITFEHDIYRGDYFNTREISREVFKERGYILLFPNVKVFYNGVYCEFEDWYIHPDLVDMKYIEKIKDKIYDKMNQDKIKELLDLLN